MRQPSSIAVKDLHFVGAQDGRPERLLKCELAAFFGSASSVTRAYLARAIYAGKQDVSVVLCLCAQGSDQAEIVDNVHKVFSLMFNGAEHLDIVFVTNEQEAQLKTRCAPFFANDKCV
jgi:hypothetical protein